MRSSTRYSPDDGCQQDAGAVGQRRHGGLRQHDAGQHGPAEAEEHGAEPAGQRADPGDLQSSCTGTEKSSREQEETCRCESLHGNDDGG